MSTCFLILTSCENMNQLQTNVPKIQEYKSFSDYIGDNIPKDFEGTVTDSIDQPIDSVYVTIGNTTSLTDKNGKFTIENTMVNEHFIFATINKEGYKNSTIDISDRDSLNNISIQLDQKGNHLCLFWFCEHNHNLK